MQMISFKELNQARSLTFGQASEKEKTAETLYRKAMEEIKKFNKNQNFNPGFLKEACRLLAEAIKLGKNKPEPYLYLAYTFYLMNKDSLSLKYLKIAKEINPQLEGITKLQDLLCRVENQPLSKTTVNRLEARKGTGNLEFNEEVKSKTSFGNQLEKVEMLQKMNDKFEFNGGVKSTTSFGSRISRAARLFQK